MKRSTLHFILAVIFAVTGVMGWNLWRDGDETSIPVADLPDIVTETFLTLDKSLLYSIGESRA
jgi:hypothetical protein